MLPIQIIEAGDDAINGKVGSLVQFDFDPHDNAHYALVMVDCLFYTLPSESVKAMKPSEVENSNAADAS